MIWDCVGQASTFGSHDVYLVAEAVSNEDEESRVGVEFKDVPDRGPCDLSGFLSL